MNNQKLKWISKIIRGGVSQMDGFCYWYFSDYYHWNYRI